MQKTCRSRRMQWPLDQWQDEEKCMCAVRGMHGRQALQAALPNVSKHLRLALPLTGKTKVAQLEQRRVIIRQQRVVELEISVRTEQRRESPDRGRRNNGAAYPI